MSESEGRLIADGMHLPVGSVTCGENYGSVGTHEGAGPVGSSLAPLQGLNSRYQEDGGGGGGGGEMSEGAAVGDLWWTERLVGEAQAEHPGELVRTGWYRFKQYLFLLPFLVQIAPFPALLICTEKI